ncbi:MAG TPA: outer membrane beta-barrel protein [Burkholderiales bacterium]
MDRIKALLAVLLPASLVGFSAPAAAQADAGWYIGAAYGMTSFDLDTAGISNPVVDDSDSGFKIYGGFQFNRHLGAEVGYVDAGKATFSGSAFPIGAFSGEVKVTAITFAAVGTLPLNESFALFARAGLAAWDAKVSANALGLGGSADDSGTDLLIGIGARFNLNKNWGLVLEYERVDTDEPVSMTSFGVRYKF